MRLHSVLDVITNSSTELFVVDQDISAEEIYALGQELWDLLDSDPASLGVGGYELETARTLRSRDWGKDARELLGEFKPYSKPPVLGHCPHCGEALLEGSLDEGYDPYAGDDAWLIEQFGEAIPDGRLYATYATDEGGYPYALLNALEKKLTTIRRHS